MDSEDADALEMEDVEEEEEETSAACDSKEDARGLSRDWNIFSVNALTSSSDGADSVLGDSVLTGAAGRDSKREKDPEDLELELELDATREKGMAEEDKDAIEKLELELEMG